MQYLDTVKPMHDRFVEPSKQYDSILPYFVFILYYLIYYIILYYIILYYSLLKREGASERKRRRTEGKEECVAKSVCVCVCVCVFVCV
jgi:phosphotransferase system  glucose/maltose/N-acetylglucosamine-specific IIC component